MLFLRAVWLLSLLVALPCRGFVPTTGASSSIRRIMPRMAVEADELAELPLFAPAEMETPFPFPAAELLDDRVYLYTFDSPASIRMIRSVECGGGLL